jgi:hypothetical protein
MSIFPPPPKMSQRRKRMPRKPRQLALNTAAKLHGWQVVKTFADERISGAKLRDKRRGLVSGSRWYRAMIQRSTRETTGG